MCIRDSLYTAPVFVMLMSIVFFREKLTGAKLTALALCLAGCVLVSGVDVYKRQAFGQSLRWTDTP